MEIRTYLRIFARFWWVIVLAVAATGGGAFLFSKVREPVYSTTARVMIHMGPNVTESIQQIDLIGQLGGRYIAGTYAQAFTAAQVRADAANQAGLLGLDANNPPADRIHNIRAYSVEANVLPDTVVVEVSGTGPDPNILANYVNATVASAISNTTTLFPILVLNQMEPAAVPVSPIEPQPSRDTLLGAVIGLAVGLLLAMALDYLLGSSSVSSVESPLSTHPGILRPPLRRARPS